MKNMKNMIKYLNKDIENMTNVYNSTVKIITDKMKTISVSTSTNEYLSLQTNMVSLSLLAAEINRLKSVVALMESEVNK